MLSSLGFCCSCSCPCFLPQVLTGVAVSDCGLSLLQFCVSVLLGDQEKFGYGELWHRVSSVVQTQTGSNPVPGCSLVPMSWWLLGGVCPFWDRNLSRSGGLTYAHRCVSTPGREALSQWYLAMKHCGTGSASGADGNQKALKLFLFKTRDWNQFSGRILNILFIYFLLNYLISFSLV